MKRLLPLLVLSLAACTTPDSNDINQNLLAIPPTSTSYQCDSGNRIILSAPTAEGIEVLYRKDRISMKVDSSAGNSSYTGGGLVWSTSENTGTLTGTDSKNPQQNIAEHCTRVLR